MPTVVASLSATAQAAHALLSKPRMSGDDVHEFRLCCKRLRAWLRLFAGAGASADRQTLGDLARTFGANRDEAVMGETLAKLDMPAERIAEVLPPAKALRLPTRQRRRVLSQQLQTLDERWQQSLREPSPAELRQAIGAQYKRARRLGRRALQSGDAAELHRWRRRVKDLGYQLELLPAPGKGLARLQKALIKLGKGLGEYHDLTVLEERLVGKADTDALLRQIQRRREALLGKSQTGFETVFGRSGKRFRRLLQ